jgi:hypothetical protein
MLVQRCDIAFETKVLSQRVHEKEKHTQCSHEWNRCTDFGKSANEFPALSFFDQHRLQMT